jgi:preprotein translocase SecE subunit
MHTYKARGAFLFGNRMKTLFTYLKNVRGELSHVVWPDRNQAIIHTGLIILVSAIVALYISGLDYVFSSVVNRLISGY